MATPDPPPPKTVLIIGGSLAGLMHALTLISLPSPPQIRILERSPTPLLHNQGAGVVAGPDVQRFFAEYVRPGRDMAVASRARQYLDRRGAVLSDGSERRTQQMTSWDLLYHLLRWRVVGWGESGYVAGLAREAGPTAEYENGCTVTDVEEAGDGRGVRVTYAHAERGAGQTATADVVVAADGASSTVRRLLLPGVERRYAGYVAWRGTVAETELGGAAREVFSDKFTFYHAPGLQILGYLIPGEEGTLEAGRRLFNWVWYCNYPADGAELEELMTDVDGRRHAVTLPVGRMKERVWARQKLHAAEVLPPQFAEAVAKTRQPFVQAITDVISPEHALLGGRVLLVGDALAGFRPHTAASTGQAAFDALAMGMWMRGEIRREEYGRRVTEFARTVQGRGVEMGERSQFGRHPLSGDRRGEGKE